MVSHRFPAMMIREIQLTADKLKGGDVIDRCKVVVSACKYVCQKPNISHIGGENL